MIDEAFEGSRNLKNLQEIFMLNLLFIHRLAILIIFCHTSVTDEWPKNAEMCRKFVIIKNVSCFIHTSTLFQLKFYPLMNTSSFLLKRSSPYNTIWVHRILKQIDLALVVVRYIFLTELIQFLLRLSFTLVLASFGIFCQNSTTTTFWSTF